MTSARSRVALSASMGVATFVAYLPGAGRAFDFDSAETVGLFIATPSLLDPLRTQRLFNNHPLFSLMEHVIYTVGGSSDEAVLRILPITFGACTVALLVGALHRSVGPLAAFCGGLVLATNPTVIELSRSVRGYSLLLLCATAASLALPRLLDDPRRAHLAAAYVVAVTVGVGTHLYMVVVVVAHVVAVVSRGAVDDAWIKRWMLGLGFGGAVHVAMASQLLAAGDEGGRAFQPDFPVRLAGVVLGSGAGAVLIGAVVLLGAAFVLPRRRDLLASLAAVASVVAFTWLVLASVHLAARFHLWLVPAAAFLAAAAVSRRPALAVAVLAGATINVMSVVDGYTKDPSALPELAAILERAADAGTRGCVPDVEVLPMLAYTDRFEPVLSVVELAECDVVVAPFPVLDPALVSAARREMPVATPAGAFPADGLVFARDAVLLER